MSGPTGFGISVGPGGPTRRQIRNSIYLFDLIEGKWLFSVGIYVPVILNGSFPPRALTDYVFGNFVKFRVNGIKCFDIRNLSLRVDDE